jgi:DNA-binding MarR family transcriptional regulator
MTQRKPGSQDEVATWLPDHLPRWLDALSHRLSADLVAQVRSSGLFLDLRGGDRRILQMIPPGTIRITDLAALAGMTKQALGEFVGRLEQAGLVSSSKDPSDGRVRLVSRTASGDAAVAATAQAIDAVESRWRAEIGPDAYDAMLAAMRRLGRGQLLPPRPSSRHDHSPARTSNDEPLMAS